jgi:hypothetical protein
LFTKAKLPTSFKYEYSSLYFVGNRYKFACVFIAFHLIGKHEIIVPTATAESFGKKLAKYFCTTINNAAGRFSDMSLLRRSAILPGGLFV